jgi:DNA processing protein
MTYHPTACAMCLRHARLLAHLAPYIEKRLVGSAKDKGAPQLLNLGTEDLVTAVAPDIPTELLLQNASVSDDELQTEVAESGYWCCCQHDPQFPAAFAQAPGAPWALFGAGDPLLLTRLRPESAVALVGSRRASVYGREVARTLGRDLAQAGLTVISGLAFGIDACAHRGAPGRRSHRCGSRRRRRHPLPSLTSIAVAAGLRERSRDLRDAARQWPVPLDIPGA